jgi:hypothetical protein
MSKYNFGSQSGNDNEYNEINFSITPETTIRGHVERLVVGNKGGQSVGFVMSGVSLVDGVLMERKDSPGKVKLFSWNALGFLDGEDFGVLDAPERHSESFRETYHYAPIAAAISSDPLAGEPDSTAVYVDGEFVESDGAYEVGNIIMWERGAKKPSSSAKRLAKLLTEQGEAAVLQTDSLSNWLSTPLTLREDLEGLEIAYFKQIRPGDNYDFHYPVLIDLVTGAQVVMDNTVGAPIQQTPGVETDGGASAAMAPAQETTAEAAETTADALPGPVDGFIRAMATFGVEDDATILDQLYETADNADSPLTHKMIDAVSEETILQEIHNR